MPAKAGIQSLRCSLQRWVPASAGTSGLVSPIQFSNSRADVRHRPYSLRRRVRRSPSPPKRGKIRRPPTRARGTPGRRNAPQSCACGSEFRCTGVVTARCRFPGAPRAVFEVCSAPPPVDFPFRRPLELGRLSTASGPKRCPAHLTVPAAAVSGAQRRAEWHAGTTRLGPPDTELASHLQRPAPATASRPTSEDADQTPLEERTGWGCV